MPNEKIPPPINEEEDSALSGSDKETQDITNKFLSIDEWLKKKDQKHRHDNEDRVTKWGIWIVCGIIALTFLITIFGAFFEQYDLFKEFFTIASTGVTLVLGYLFGKKS